MKIWQWILDKYYVWKLLKAVAVLRDRVSFNREILGVAKSMEATLAMTEGLSKNRPVALMLTRNELQAFVKYVTRLHDTKLTLLQEAKYGATALMMKNRLSDEDIEQLKAINKQTPSILTPQAIRTKAQRSKMI